MGTAPGAPNCVTSTAATQQEQPDPHPPDYQGYNSSWDALKPPRDSPDPPWRWVQGRAQLFPTTEVSSHRDAPILRAPPDTLGSPLPINEPLQRGTNPTGFPLAGGPAGCPAMVVPCFPRGQRSNPTGTPCILVDTDGDTPSGVLHPLPQGFPHPPGYKGRHSSAVPPLLAGCIGSHLPVVPTAPPAPSPNLSSRNQRSPHLSRRPPPIPHGHSHS